MKKSFWTRPALHAAGRRHAFCRYRFLSRCRGRAAALSAPPSGPTSSASQIASETNDDATRLRGLPAAVLSCVSPAVDQRGSENAFHDASGSSNGNGSNGSGSSSGGYHVWTFDTASSCDEHHLLHEYRLGDLTSTNRAVPITTSVLVDALVTGARVDDATSNNGSSSSRTSSLALELRDQGHRGESFHDNWRPIGIGSSSNDSAMGCGRELDTLVSSCEHVPRSETNATASSSSSNSNGSTREMFSAKRRRQRHSCISGGGGGGSISTRESARPVGPPQGISQMRRHAPVREVLGVRHVDSREPSGRSQRDTKYMGDLPPGFQARRINQALLEAGAWRHHHNILELVEASGRDFGRINVATALHRLGSCGLQAGSWEARKLLMNPRFGRLERLVGEFLPVFTGREVANCLWALAKLGYCSGDGGSSSSSGGGSSGGGGASCSGLLEGLCAREEILLSELGSQEVANSLWALGTLGHHPGETLLHGLTHRLGEVLTQARPQEVSISLLGLAKLEWSPGPDVLDKVARGSLGKIREFKPQELSNTMWSLARLGYYNDQLQTAIFRQALKRAADFKPQELSSLVLEAATLELGLHGDPSREVGSSSGSSTKSGVSSGQHGLIPEQLLRTFCDLAKATVHRYGHHELSNLLWSSAKLGYAHEGLLRAAASQAAKQLAEEEAEEREVPGPEVGLEGPRPRVMPTNSAGRSGSRSSSVNVNDTGSSLSGSAGFGSTRSRHSWSSRSVISALWSYATLGFHPGDDFLRQVCCHLALRRHLSNVPLHDLVRSAWALATLQYQGAAAALAAVEAEVVARLAQDAAGGGHRRATETEVGEDEEEEVADGEALGGRALLQPHHITDLLWSYATLQQPAPGLFATLLPLLKRRLSQCGNAMICKTLWAAASLGVYHRKLMDAVAAHVCSYRLPYLRPQELATLAWAYGELGHAHKALFDGIALHTVSYVWPRTDSALTLRELATVCASAGLFGWRYPLLLDAAARMMESLQPHEKLRRGGQQWMPHPHDSGGHSRAATTAQLTMVAPAATATLMLDCISSSASCRSGVVAAGRAAVTMAVENAIKTAETVIEAVVTEASCCTAGKPLSPTPQLSSVASTCSSCSTTVCGGASSSDPNAGVEASAAAATVMTAAALVSEHDVANLCWGLSLMGSCNPQIWNQMMELLGRLGEARRGGAGGGGGEVAAGLSEDALARMCQAYLHMRLDHPTAKIPTGPTGLLRNGAQALRRLSAVGCHDKGRADLASSSKVTAAAVSGAEAVAAGAVATVLQPQLEAGSCCSSSSALLRRQVSESLFRVGLQHSREVLTEDGLFCVDLALQVELPLQGGAAPGQAPGPLHPLAVRGGPDVTSTSISKATTTPMTGSSRVIRIAVEVDGPSHFTSNTRQPLGPTIYRRRCLEDRGWRVVSVPYWIWNQAGSKPEEQDALLLQMMREARLGEVLAATAAAGAKKEKDAHSAVPQRRRQAHSDGNENGFSSGSNGVPLRGKAKPVER